MHWSQNPAGQAAILEEKAMLGNRGRMSGGSVAFVGTRISWIRLTASR